MFLRSIADILIHIKKTNDLIQLFVEDVEKNEKKKKCKRPLFMHYTRT